MRHPCLSRRTFCRALTAATVGWCTSPGLAALVANHRRQYPIGVCDWSLDATGRIGAIETARQIGLDGVQVSFGPPGRGLDLRRPEARATYADACNEHGMTIASLAMGCLNDFPYATDDGAQQWVVQCIDAMVAMKQRVVLLAFFSKGDILDQPKLQQNVIARLKAVVPKAEKAGVVLGLETWLSADDHLRILDAVGSPAVQVYYDVANMDKRGYDIYADIRRLGRERICQIHAKEYGHLLGSGRIDFQKVRAALDEIEWTGWLVIEGATVSDRPLLECHRYNQQYLRSVFAPAPETPATD